MPHRTPYSCTCCCRQRNLLLGAAASGLLLGLWCALSLPTDVQSYLLQVSGAADCAAAVWPFTDSGSLVGMNMACGGGDWDAALDYLKEAGGIMPEASYPYKGADGFCKDGIHNGTSSTAPVRFKVCPSCSRRTSFA